MPQKKNFIKRHLLCKVLYGLFNWFLSSCLDKLLYPTVFILLSNFSKLVQMILFFSGGIFWYYLQFFMLAYSEQFKHITILWFLPLSVFVLIKTFLYKTPLNFMSVCKLQHIFISKYILVVWTFFGNKDKFLVMLI